MSAPAIDDARILFDNYIDTTKGIVRCVGEKAPFSYPPGPTEMDMLAFATVFSHLWQAISDKSVFSAHYAAKKAAFQHLVEAITPDPPFHPYTGFWEQSGTSLTNADATTEAGMRSFCRTLRNGFNHFNYRYVDMSPDAYFVGLGTTTPSGIRDPASPFNYRIFICDHLPKDKKAKKPLKLMDPASDTRVLETGFGHIRYHLYYFLGRFFEAEGGRSPLELLALGK